MYNGDSNANVKTQIGFDKYNNNFACAEHMLKLSDATFYGGCTHNVQFFYYFLN